MKKSYILIAIILAITIQNVIAETQDSSKSKQITAPNVIYCELATMLTYINFSLNYERFITENLGIRIGYGWGVGMESGDKVFTGKSPMFMVMYLTGDRSKLELGLGLSYTYDYSDYSGGFRFTVLPAVSIGYRYQPRESDFLIRAGLTLNSAFGGPFEVSLGYAF